MYILCIFISYIFLFYIKRYIIKFILITWYVCTFITNFIHNYICYRNGNYAKPKIYLRTLLYLLLSHVIFLYFATLLKFSRIR